MIPRMARERRGGKCFKGWRSDPDMSTFLRDCIDYPGDGSHGWVGCQMLKAFDSNERIIKRRARILRASGASLAALCVVVVVFAFLTQL